jgi:hypothetical protein
MMGGRARNAVSDTIRNQRFSCSRLGCRHELITMPERSLGNATTHVADANKPSRAFSMVKSSFPPIRCIFSLILLFKLIIDELFFFRHLARCSTHLLRLHLSGLHEKLVQTCTAQHSIDMSKISK